MYFSSKKLTHYDQKPDLSSIPSFHLQEKHNIIVTGVFQGLHMIDNSEKQKQFPKPLAFKLYIGQEQLKLKDSFGLFHAK